MALRVGIHSDKNLRDSCLEYNAFPVGFANADFEGGLSNPYLSGIKVSKYQRSAPKPVSADVLAVNGAKYMTGNAQQNARGILSQYQKEAKEWVPPPVKLQSAAEEWDRVYNELAKEGRESDVFDYQTREEVRKERNDRFYNTLQPKLRIPSRGTQMVVETISSQAQLPDMDAILNRYRELPTKAEQVRLSEKLRDDLQAQGIIMDSDFNWTASKTGSINIRSQEIRKMVLRGFAQGTNIDLLTYFSPMSGAVADPLYGEGRPGGIPPPPSEAGSSSDVAGSSSVASQALTQQGIAQPATTQLTPQIERK